MATLNPNLPNDQQSVDDVPEDEIEQAYLAWENSINYQIEDLGVQL